MYTLVFINQKGGVTKTTTAYTTAYILAEIKKFKVLLIDLNPQKNSTKIFIDNYESLPTKETIYATFYDERPLVIHKTRLPNLDVVASHISMYKVEKTIEGQVGSERILETALNAIKNSYDFVLLDTPPNLGFTVVNALTASNGLVIPISHGGFEKDGLKDLMETIAKVKKYYNPSLKVLGFVQTLTDPTNLSNEFRTELLNKYSDKVFESSIPRAIVIPESQDLSQVVFEYETTKEGHKVAKKKKLSIENSYIKFTNELLFKIKNDAK